MDGIFFKLYYNSIKVNAQLETKKQGEKMNLELFLNFDGNCREALEFYSKVFKSDINNLMTYGQMPPDPNLDTVIEADKDKVMYAGLVIGGTTVMFCDMPSDSPLIIGNNINPTLSMNNKEEITNIFNELKSGGEV
jgi:PhnB protein